MARRTTNIRRQVAAVAAFAVLVGAMQVALAAKPGLLHRQTSEGGTPTAAAAAATTAPAANDTSASRPAYQVAERSETAQSALASPQLGAGQPNEHPLMPTLRWAEGGLKNLEQIQDYSATVVKRERIGGKVLDYEYMFIKVRHRPFSVYMYFVGPPDLKGQEVIYVKDQNDGKMLAHGVGFQRTFGTVQLKPEGPIAMRNQRYPITELGILNLTRRLVEVGEKDKNYGECEVKYLDGAKISDSAGNERVCTCIEVVHPIPRKNFLFHLAQIFVDKELNLPIRYASYDWPKETGGAPELLEEYTYLNLKLNNGFTDGDFDIRNPNYKFPPR